MSTGYNPSPQATSAPSQSTIFLSQRDLGLDVPINFVTQPGVSFSTACFSDLIYEDESFEACFSNLLAVGFRRFEVDAYWDQARQTWSFCPISISTNLSDIGPTPTTSTFSTSASAIFSDTTPTDATASGTSLASSVLALRQISSPSVSLAVTATSNGTKFSSTFSSYTLDSMEANLSFPPYQCTSTLNLSIMMNLLVNYIQKTENTLAAHLIYVILNLHASASAAAPTLPAPSPSILPSSSELLGQLFLTNMSTYLYTRLNLFSERTDLNNSWYTVAETYRPASGYYTTNRNEYDVVSTEDGWPSESYIEFSKSKRLLLTYGTVDPQMEKYNFTGDENTIFPAGFMQSNESIEVDTTDNIKSGCFLTSNLTNITLGVINSSWASASSATNSDFSTNLTSALNFTNVLLSCGISPFLNTTLLNTTANSNYTPYQNYSQSTIWTWAPDQPRTWTEGDPGSDDLFRCARTSANSPYGKWHVADCSTKNYAACRMPDQPYNWTLTTYQTSYSYATDACPDPYIFAAPRTALENAYLHQTLLALFHQDSPSPNNANSAPGIWLDFNSLEIKTCWVTGGANATCPYSVNTGLRDEIERQTILVPTIAAIIVLIVSLLTVFVKVVGNKNSVSRMKRRRRRRGGVFYEGVPS